MISEYEPIEAFALLTDDDLDLALTYDYNLAPASAGPVLETVPLWTIAWGLGVPADHPDGPADLADFADRRGSSTPATPLTKTLCARWRRWPGSPRRIAHQIDSLDLVEDLIVAGYGVGLLPDRPADRQRGESASADRTQAILTAYAVTRRGRSTWPPLRVVLDRMRPPRASSCRARSGRGPTAGRQHLRPAALSPARAPPRVSVDHR